MKLIKPKVEILDQIDGQAILERIEQIARTCYKSEPKYIRVSADRKRWVWEDSEDFKLLGEEGETDYPIRVSNTADKLVKRLIESKHEAMLEFVDVTVKFTCDRITSQSIVRHRIASFAQESTRYCNYSKDKFNGELTFIIPSWLNIPEGEYKYNHNCTWVNADNTDEVFVDFRDEINNDKEKEATAISTWLTSLGAAEEAYIRLTQRYNKQAQQARMVLPMSIKTEINMKANLREWRHFFKLRCHRTAHPDIRALALDLLKQMHERIPIVFDDLYKEFIENASKG